MKPSVVIDNTCTFLSQFTMSCSCDGEYRSSGLHGTTCDSCKANELIEQLKGVKAIIECGSHAQAQEGAQRAGGDDELSVSHSSLRPFDGLSVSPAKRSGESRG